ncbi:MAG TPA: MBL fold metallo-hydrolase [Hyphomicrobiaceae bacterium]|nr:MBL fold metallo-hydrolase [Hyphomicrobiaceae bacterium]
MSGADRQLHYTHTRHPMGAETIELAPGLLWARFPLPFRLNHINVWLLREDDGWTLIDTATTTREALDLWEALLSGPLSGAPVRRLIATHGHTDHVGLAGWLVDRVGGVPFVATLAEWHSPQVRIIDAKQPMRPDTMRFLESHGCDQPTVAAYAQDRAKTHALLGPLPASFLRITDGETIRFGGRAWRVMVCGGHASEHASFYCEEERILIAGDQVLSKISPMIGVFPQEPWSDPLTEYLASLDRFRVLPEDTLVLPSHGMPFRGLHVRVDQLADHHEARLDTLVGLMGRPEVAMTLARGLFPKAVDEGQGRHALAETLAHIHRLVTTGRARRNESGGKLLFERTDR